MVIILYYVIAGFVLILAGLLVNRQHPKKWRTQSNILYVAGMGLILYAVAIMHDPIEGIPTDVWNIIQYIIIFLTFYGFLYKIERDMRSDFNDRLGEIKNELINKIDGAKHDIQRDIDRLERRTDDIEKRISTLGKKR